MEMDRKKVTCSSFELVKASPARVLFHRVYRHWRKNGAWATVQKVAGKVSPREKQRIPGIASAPPRDGEVLNLQPGELVEVKTSQEIMATLDRSGRTRGLSFMPEMWKFCGKSYRVFKRVDQIMVESTGSLRKIYNTVLLDGVYCDGSEHRNCDSSCFHYWREAWVRRSPVQEVPAPLPPTTPYEEGERP